MTYPWPILAADTIERRLEFAYVPHGWAAVASIVLLGAILQAVILFYRREQRVGASPAVRSLLATLRCGVIGVLVLIWLQPIRATYIHREMEARTLLLVDGSASMSLRDRYGSPGEAERVAKALKTVGDGAVPRMTRAELAQAMLGDARGGLLNQLAAHNPVQVYQFGDKLVGLGQVTRAGQVAPIADTQPADEQTPAPASMPAIDDRLATADAPATDVGQAVRHAVESQAGTPIAAVVVVSDGRFNRGEPPEVIARYARDKKIPIYAVGVGDPSEPRNVAVTAVEAPANVFVKDPFQITAHLHAQGLAGQTLAVDLLQGGSGGETVNRVASKTVTVNAAGHVEPVAFAQKLTEAAQVRWIVRVAEVDGEILTDDNQQDVTVRALDNKMRVLLVAGAPSWEYRYLSHLLERDATVDVSCWLQSADETALRDGKTLIERFPTTREELSVYDCIVLLDPQPEGFTPSWSASVEAMVANSGCGLLYVAGGKNTPRFTRQADTRPLIEMLPVVIDPAEADLILNELGHFQPMAWPLTIPPGVASHPILAIGTNPADNAEVWSKLPGVYWHYPVRRAKPVATVLLRHSNPRMRNPDGGHVLLATQFLGSGRTGFLAYDGTWRWRRFGDEYLNRFWIQMLRYLVEGKLLSGQKRGLIQTDRDNDAVGEPVTVEARLLDAQYLPLQQKEVAATVHREGEPQGAITLTAQPERPGWYRGRWVPTRTGRYTLSVTLPGQGGGGPESIRHEMRVGQADIEFRQTPLDREALKLLAAQSADGAYLDLDEAGRLVELIPSRTVSLVLDGQPLRLWDRWWTLAVLVALLSVEWTLRKRACLL